MLKLDYVSQCKLIAKLRNYKFNNNTIVWVKNFLFLEYNKLNLSIRYHHGACEMLNGVVQGCFFGPIYKLFTQVLYLNAFLTALN